jgi:hypothetical protein
MHRKRAMFRKYYKAGCFVIFLQNGKVAGLTLFGGGC